ncbi:MAG TPA: hypothetical protein VKO43_05975 [Candidatus Krumholzibacteriaceae bacterium]|nr:hypothetical protein [Candidatus Krumholzibacteriaceae bacterium]
MKGLFRNTLFIIAAALLLVGVSKSVEGISGRNRKADIMYLPSSEAVRMFSLGYRNIVSDILWFKTVQYYGGYRMGKNSLRLFRHLADVITDLDPRFIFAYKLSAVIMAQDLGELEEGIEILRKGIENNPAEWSLAFEAGFLYYLDGNDYKESQRYFRLAADMPGADERAMRFAASAAARGGDVETSINMWRRLADSSNDPFMDDLAAGYIEKLEKKLSKKEKD